MSERLDALVVREDEKSGKSYWTRIGVAFQTKDGWLVKLDALPIGGTIILKPPLPKRGREPGDDSGGF